jgi:molecular chaperone DnaJ
MTHYEVMGLPRKARIADIKRAYKRLARKHHPDLNPGDRRAEETFKALNEAYSVLGDPARRKAYDRELEGATTPRAPSGPAPETAWDAAGFDPSSLGVFSSFFSDFLREPAPDPSGRTAPRPGDDVMRTVSIDFFAALRGLSAAIDIDAETACERCHGAGRVASATRRPCPDCAASGRISRFAGPLRLATHCPRCEGEGVLGWDGCGACAGAGILTHRETIEVQIPSGVDDGSRVRVPGRGRAGRNGGAPGDLFVITRVATHPFFLRIGDNIHCTVPITVSEAALGTRIEVPTIDGRARIRIPPGTETGQKFRLRGKGSPSLRGTARGDHYIETRVVTPAGRTDRCRRLLEELGGLEPGEELRRGLFA